MFLDGFTPLIIHTFTLGETKMSDLSDSSNHSDPTYVPEPEELEKTTKTKAKPKAPDDSSKKSPLVNKVSLKGVFWKYKRN